MTGEQASELVQRCSATADYPPTKEHLAALRRHLLPKDFERMIPVVEMAVRQTSKTPSIHTLEESYKQVYCEGIPGAAAYKPQQARTGMSESEVYGIWRQQRLQNMPDSAYWDYIAARRKGEHGRQETAWRHEYEQGITLDQIAGRV